MSDRPPVPNALKAFESQASGRLLQVNGETLHCIEAGPESGPLVILLHGFPEFWWGWRYQIEPLAKAGFRVLVPDQRGYNISSKPLGRVSYHIDKLAEDVVALSRALGRENFSVVGHDWGGIVAWWVASRYPNQVERLIVINAPHISVVGRYMRRHPRQMLRSAYAAFFQVPYLPEAMLSAKGYRALRNTLKSTSRPDTFTESDLARYESAWGQPGALTAMLNWYRALPLASQKRVQANLEMPVLAIWGLGDGFLEFGLCEESLELCTKGEVFPVEQGTHWVHLELPEIVNQKLIGFLK